MMHLFILLLDGFILKRPNFVLKCHLLTRPLHIFFQHCPSTNTEECSDHGTCNEATSPTGDDGDEAAFTGHSWHCSCNTNLHFKGGASMMI
jgi:hypothetical protein